MEIQEATQLAEFFLSRLKPACDRIEIVGSVKRQDKKEVHDIEILMIPKNQKPVPQFGRPNDIYLSLLDKVLADLHYEELLRHAMDKKDGPRYKKRAIVGAAIGNDFCLDMFIVTAATWGLQNVIRTGPGLFSHRFVTNQNQTAYDRNLNKSFSGFLPNHLKYIKGKDNNGVSAIRNGEEDLILPEEEDAIDILGLGWIPCNLRGQFALNK